MLISKVFLAVEIARLKKMHISKVAVKRGENIIFLMIISTVLLVTVEID
jgi:hypothetical protein